MLRNRENTFILICRHSWTVSADECDSLSVTVHVCVCVCNIKPISLSHLSLSRSPVSAEEVDVTVCDMMLCRQPQRKQATQTACLTSMRPPK